jgi:hypothetical protein
MLGIKRSQARCRQVGSGQQSALSHKLDLFTAKVAKDAKEEGNFPFLFSFACFSSVAVRFLLIAEC